LIVPANPAYAGRLLRRESDGSLVDHADLSGLPSGFNEIVVDGRGNIYGNGADFDFMAFLENVQRDGEDAQQVPWRERADFVPGFIALITPDGTVRQVADGIEFPNGMVVTPDNSTLIISESFAGRLTAFDIAADGSLSNRRVWADGLGPDGICLDAEGAVWTSSGGNDCVRVREGGEVLQRIELDRGALRVHAWWPGQENAVHHGSGVASGEPVRRTTHRPGADRPGACTLRRLALASRQGGTQDVDRNIVPPGHACSRCQQNKPFQIRQ
jgi:hypothetical protein